MLIRVDAADPATLAFASISLAFVALIATWIPTLRATQLEPMRAR